MNIAFVNSTRKWGGVKTWCIDTATALKELNINSIIFGKDKRFIDRATQRKIESHPIKFGPDYNPILIYKLYSFFKKRKIQFVVANVGKDIKSAGIAARIAGIPLIVHIGSPGDIKNKFENKILHFFTKPVFVCCSEYTKSGFLKNVPYAKKFKIAAIHPGTEISKHEIQTNNTLKIITTSQLNKDKRHIDVLEACKILADRKLKFFLNIIGEGALSAELKVLVQKLGLTDRVFFSGYVNDVTTELRAADIFILPSQCEPLGIALEEAMANGLVPIARNAGGAPEIWPEFLASHLLPSESRGAEFAEILSTLLHRPWQEIHELKNRVRDHAAQTFSIELQTKKFLDFMLSSRHDASLQKNKHL
ncbi:MAG: glycosyltransferase [Desulfomicrobium sp.]|nr:glycosyltransferase [Pseudomonadota bacterium]MBV1713022.1 glycosyltransferase [Desulfomicrobium sp.]MBU4571992.1 glycosyltransferase [Pseudomonadota bacterium]MBU4596141.1 glycosyltransferase [Pseudomonadota bacterium]MBV1721445.1 glycosyltransferase [Desulfomicrobium sp.]